MKRGKKTGTLMLSMMMLVTAGAFAPAMAESLTEVSEIVCEEIEVEEVCEDRTYTEETAKDNAGTVQGSGTENGEYTVSEVRFIEDGLLILPRPVKAGKVFVEWNIREDGTGTGYKAGAIVDPTDIVLYSIWKEAAEEPKAEAEIAADEAVEEGTEAR